MVATTQHLSCAAVVSHRFAGRHMHRTSSATLFERSDKCKCISSEFEGSASVDILEKDGNRGAPLLNTNGTSQATNSTNWVLSEMRDPSARKAVVVEFMAQV